MYFDTSRSEYGKLSKQSLEDLNAGAGGSGPKQEKPADFALWKNKSPGSRPGTAPGARKAGLAYRVFAMSTKYLGQTIDIHAGGQDLIFPHHENEIAQSEGASNKPFASTGCTTGL